MINLVPFTGLVAGNRNTVYASNSMVITGQNGNVLVNSNVYINSSGNVGIGTTNPFDKLNVYGNLRFSNSTVGVSGIYFADGTFQSTAGGGGGGGGASIYTFSYVGNGTTSAYGTSPYTGDVNQTSVFINGVYQRKSTYTWTGTTLTFSSPPPNFSTIEINILASVGNVNTVSTQSRQTYTASSGQTAFTVTGGYASGQIDIYQNGSKLNVGTDVIAVDGSSFTLTNPARAGDTIEIVALYGVFASFPNAYPITGGTLSGNMIVGGGAISTSTSTGAIVIGSSGGIGVGGNINVGGQRSLFSGNIAVFGTNAATSSTTGALIVTGGVGVGGDIYAGAAVIGTSYALFNQNVTINSTNATTSSTTGAFVVAGGVGINGAVITGSYLRTTQNVTVSSTNAATSTTTGALLVSGGAGIAGAAYVGGAIVGSSYGLFTQNVTVSSTNAATSTTTGALVVSGGAGIAGAAYVGGAIVGSSYGLFTQNVTVSSTNAATSTTTGALLVSGGAGIAGAAYVGGAIVGSSYGLFTQNVTVSSTNVAISTSTGGLVLSGGAGIAGNVWLGGNVVLGSSAASRNQFWGNNNDTAIQPSFTWSSNTSSGMFLPNTNTVAFSTSGTERMRIDSSGNVGIGTATITTGYRLQVEGGFAATTKSFVINHPTKPGQILRHGSLEGPENGVYVRGRSTETVISLPDYWTGLVDPGTITVNITPIGRRQSIYVTVIRDNLVYLGSDDLTTMEYFYSVFAERKDVDKLTVEE